MQGKSENVDKICSFYKKAGKSLGFFAIAPTLYAGLAITPGLDGDHPVGLVFLPFTMGVTLPLSIPTFCLAAAASVPLAVSFPSVYAGAAILDKAAKVLDNVKKSEEEVDSALSFSS